MATHQANRNMSCMQAYSFRFFIWERAGVLAFPRKSSTLSCWSITQRRAPVPVVTLDITHRSPFMEGRPFGDVGPYQWLEGTVRFAVDPFHSCNAVITDIALAPRDTTGKVGFSAHFAMLQPLYPERGNRRLFFDVVNRGRKTVMSYFNSAPRALDPTAPLDPGNGFLMRQGYTIVWCAW